MIMFVNRAYNHCKKLQVLSNQVHSTNTHITRLNPNSKNNMAIFYRKSPLFSMELQKLRKNFRKLIVIHQLYKAVLDPITYSEIH